MRPFIGAHFFSVLVDMFALAIGLGEGFLGGTQTLELQPSVR